jgi:hypothetical protein
MPSAGARNPAGNTAFFGCFLKKERWFLSLRGTAIVLLCAFSVLFFFGRKINHFLSVTNRVPAELLVVEGWTPPWGMVEVAAEFQKQNYQHLLIVRPVLDPDKDYDLSYSSVDFAIAALKKNGVPEERVSKIFTLVVRKDRTFHSALSVKEWIATNRVSVTGLNVATIGAHARRSGLLYRKAMPDLPVGTISLQPREYRPDRWWRYSEGFRETVGEFIAYLYARFLFTAD